MKHFNKTITVEVTFKLKITFKKMQKLDIKQE